MLSRPIRNVVTEVVIGSRCLEYHRSKVRETKLLQTYRNPYEPELCTGARGPKAFQRFPTRPGARCRNYASPKMKQASPFWIFVLVWIVAAAASDTTVTTTQQFRDAFINPEVNTIYLHDTLKLNVTEWTSTVALNRSLLVSASPARLASRTYVELDLSDLQMMYSVSPGQNITFRGLQVGSGRPCNTPGGVGRWE